MTLVQCHGCFDFLHYGHLKMLEFARTQGDRLVVSITADRFVRAAKGPDRPMFDQNARAEMLRALRCVDDVMIVDDPGPKPAILKWRPRIYVKGREYVGRLPEQALVEFLGGRVLFFDSLPIRTGQLIKEINRA